MIMTSINKVKFASLNDKRYYGPDGIVSLPFGHPLLNEVREYKIDYQKFTQQLNKKKIKFYCLRIRPLQRTKKIKVVKKYICTPVNLLSVK